MKENITIIGGGLAGCEAAWQAVHQGVSVTLYDMKPAKFSPAHSSENLAELVCSNSMRSDDTTSAVGLLKEEMRQLNSLLMNVAEETKVPAGKALAVDREKFAAAITKRISNHPDITIIREEISHIPHNEPTILATGPLTSEPLTAALMKLTGQEHLSFYDAIAPIISADSLDRSIIFQASRYEDGPGDYLNCPMNKEEYLRFADAMAKADTVPLHSFEKKKYFEGCLPIEVMLERGIDTPRFGPMKPVGLPDPRLGHDTYAVVQLRMEDREGNHYNMVGFQTKLTYPSQKKVFRLIPGMEKAHFIRLGSIHRNTFVCAPEILDQTLQVKKQPMLFLAGQLSGVEGYVESIAMGLLAGINAARLALLRDLVIPPEKTAHGALIHHLTNREVKRFQPSNVNYSLFPSFDKQAYKASLSETELNAKKGRRNRLRIGKRDKATFRSKIALATMEKWVKTVKG